MLRRFLTVLLAATVAAGPALAQVAPGDPTPGGTNASAPRHHHRRHHRAHHRRHHAARPVAMGINPNAGLNGSGTLSC